MMQVAEANKDLVKDGVTTTPEQFKAVAEDMKAKFIAAVADGEVTFKDLFEPQ